MCVNFGYSFPPTTLVGFFMRFKIKLIVNFMVSGKLEVLSYWRYIMKNILKIVGVLAVVVSLNGCIWPGYYHGGGHGGGYHHGGGHRR